MSRCYLMGKRRKILAETWCLTRGSVFHSMTKKERWKKRGFFIFCGVFAHLSVVLIKKKWELSRSTSSLSYSKGVYMYCTWQMVLGKKGVIGFYEGTSRLDPFYVLSMSWWDDFISLLNTFFLSFFLSLHHFLKLIDLATPDKVQNSTKLFITQKKREKKKERSYHVYLQFPLLNH